MIYIGGSLYVALLPLSDHRPNHSAAPAPPPPSDERGLVI